MKLYQAFEVDDETPVQYLAVHPLRWQEHWGEPSIMFREVDDKMQALADAAPALLEACKAERAYWEHFVDCPSCKPGYECSEASRLWNDARRKRTSALTQAESEDQ